MVAGRVENPARRVTYLAYLIVARLIAPDTGVINVAPNVSYCLWSKYMIANYGYMDGSGEYFITIDTDKCMDCQQHGCVDACPEGMFSIETDDYDDEVATVKEEFRHKLKYACGPCKPVSDRPPLPCVTACTSGALSHSW